MTASAPEYKADFAGGGSYIIPEYGQDDSVLLRMLRFTAPFDFAGNPTITMPSGIDAAGLPLSLQLVGTHVSEALLCRAGHAFQQRTDWHTRRPPEP